MPIHDGKPLCRGMGRRVSPIAESSGDASWLRAPTRHYLQRDTSFSNVSIVTQFVETFGNAEAFRSKNTALVGTCRYQFQDKAPKLLQTVGYHGIEFWRSLVQDRESRRIVGNSIRTSEPYQGPSHVSAGTDIHIPHKYGCV